MATDHSQRLMPPRATMRSRMSAFRRTEDAVTPVVGTILVLGITIVGMAAVLAWGAPTIEAIQAQNAQVAMVGEFEDLRASSIELSIPDASRIPTVVLPRGTLGIGQGTHIMVTADHASSSCDFHVTNWNNAVPDLQASYSGATCGTPGAGETKTLEVLQVVGSNTVTKTTVANPAAAGTVGITTGDFGQGNWLFRLTNGAANPTIYAQAWLFDTDRVSWTLGTGRGTVAAYYDLGGVFSVDGPATYVEKGPSLQESDAGSSVYSLRLRTLTDSGGSSVITGRGSYQVFLGLVGNYARINGDQGQAYRLRFDLQGDLGESWCNTFLARNDSLAGDPYVEDGTMPCKQSSTTAVRSLTYTRGGTPFTAEVIHASMLVSLGL